MSYKTLALDLDGTLTDSNKRVTPFTKKMLFAAMEKGVNIVLASGRPDVGIRALASELELDKRGGYILAFNGGRVVDCKTNQVVFETFFEKRYCDAVLSVKEKFNGVEVITYSEKEILTENATQYVMEEQRCLNCPVTEVENLSEHLPPSIIKFLVVGEHERLLPVEEYFKQNFAGKFDVYFSQPFFLEVVPLGVDKASALEKLNLLTGNTKEQLMACGDGKNDMPMLRVAGLSVAMENAHPDVKAMADFVTADNDHEGVGLAVEKFIIKGESLC